MRIPSPLKRGRRHQGVSPFIDWKVYLSIYLSIHPSMYLSIIQCVYIYIYLLKRMRSTATPSSCRHCHLIWSYGPQTPQSTRFLSERAKRASFHRLSLNFARSSLGPEAKFTSWVDPSGGSNGESANHGGLAVYFFIVFIHPLIPSDSMWFLHLDIVEICRHRNQRVYESGILHCLSTNCRQSWLGSVICSLFPGCLGLIL